MNAFHGQNQTKMLLLLLEGLLQLRKLTVKTFLVKSGLRETIPSFQAVALAIVAPKTLKVNFGWLVVS